MNKTSSPRHALMPVLVVSVFCAIGFLAACATAISPAPPAGTALPDEALLFDAIASGDLPLVKSLVARDRGLIAATDQEGQSVLHAAIWSGALPVLGWLLEAGAAVEAVDELGLNPLMVAAQAGSVEAAEALLARQADPGLGNARDRHKTALIYAILSGSQGVVGILLDHGADIEQPDDDKVPPVSWAAYAAELPILRLLVERGARLDRVDGFGDDLPASAWNGRRNDNLEYLTGIGAGKKR